MTSAIAEAREEAWALALDAIDLSDPVRFETNTHWPFFDRVRDEDPVHFLADSAFGPYWSITRYDDIMAADTNHKALS
ncbi:MAG: cytochrome P450, partial [Pseudomonadota bacterium]